MQKEFSSAVAQFKKNSNFAALFTRNARMAESVDALVSNTSGRKAVPVRSRLRVLRKEADNITVCQPLFLYLGSHICTTGF